jgi:hypothetical protein
MEISQAQAESGERPNARTGRRIHPGDAASPLLTFCVTASLLALQFILSRSELIFPARVMLQFQDFHSVSASSISSRQPRTASSSVVAL